ncbi:hypothetical protein [Natrinema altunense]|uniref:Uncharacterized protein n=1 Tax=Natrinema altunense TaxID=222984 RepID=A0A482Y4Q7_9EURY|nr:hypothetical protein [Natrinema altunense]RZH68776.1 hypothetical protein ELS17_04755 [Natrinema altunense]
MSSNVIRIPTPDGLDAVRIDAEDDIHIDTETRGGHRVMGVIRDVTVAAGETGDAENLGVVHLTVYGWFAAAAEQRMVLTAFRGCDGDLSDWIISCLDEPVDVAEPRDRAIPQGGLGVVTRD